jgi:pimeloyl-ACP methyl ester carboxylesterase
MKPSPPRGRWTSSASPDHGALPYSAFAVELADLLDQQTVTGPLVVVGHSFGSLIARMFAARHPHRVAGMVHVDGSIPRGVLWCSPHVTGDPSASSRLQSRLSAGGSTSRTVDD